MTTAARLEVQVDGRTAKPGVDVAAKEMDRLKSKARELTSEFASIGKAAGGGASVAAKEMERLRTSASGASAGMGTLATSSKRAANDNGLLTAALRGTVQGLKDGAAQAERAAAAVDRARDATGRFTTAANDNGKSIGLLSGGLRLLGPLLAGVSFAALIKGAIDTNTEFQKLKVQLEVATGSASNAEKAFGAIQQLAAKTPFSVAELTTAFITLKNLGLDPSEKALVSYGNTAGAMGKTLDQTIQAVADAATGEFERLKEFGIRASVQGDQVSFTFKGITTTVANTSKEIEGYLQNIGNTDFAGGMDKQAATIGGAFSNLGDATATLALKFGEGGFNGALLKTVQGMSETASGSGELASELGGLAGDVVTAGGEILASFGSVTSGGDDMIRDLRASFTAIQPVLADLFTPLIDAANAAFSAVLGGANSFSQALSATLNTGFLESLRATLREFDSINAFGNKYLGTASTSYAADFDAARVKRKAELDGQATERKLNDPNNPLNRLGVFTGQSFGRVDLSSFGEAGAGSAGAPSAAAATKAAADAKKAANEAVRTAKDRESTFDRLNGRYDAVAAAAKSYSNELSDIVRLQDAGKISADQAAQFTKGARSAQLDVALGKREGVSDFGAGAAETLEKSLRDGELAREFEDIGRSTGAEIAQAFGDTSLDLAAAMGELIGGKAGKLISTVFTSINAPGGIINGNQIGGREGKLFDAINRFTGGEPGKPSPFTKSFTDGLTKVFDPLNKVIRDLSNSMDEVFGGIKGDGSFAKAFGEALAGMAAGQLTSDLAGSLGIKQNQTGATVGSAVGTAFGGPIGGAVGGLVGGTLGASKTGRTVLRILLPGLGQLLFKDPYGDAALTSSATGADSAFKTRGKDSLATTSSLADAVSGGIKSIADALGVTVKSGVNLGAVGFNSEEYYFSQSNTRGFKSADAQKFKTSEEAITAAIRNAVNSGAFEGLRDGTRRLLAAGGDLNTQATKALKFEDVFKELRERQDPTGAAIDELGKQLKDLRDIFKEAGASTAEYAQLEELYALKRKDILEETNSATLASMKSYLDQLKGSGSYGLSANTRYANTSAQLAQLNATRSAGGSVDFAQYQTTTDSFLQASRDLFGSTSSYFRDLDSITSTVQGLVDKGQAEADKAAANQPVVDAITAQTTATIAALDAVRAAVQANGAGNDNGGGGGGEFARNSYYMEF